MKPQMISAIADKHAGKPILVICGGYSAATDLPKIPLDLPSCVISANEHGFKQDRFKVDYIVSVDWFYGTTRERMDEKLSEYRTPHINRWSWADYRIPEWTFSGDSGLTAVLVASMLGGHPVIVVGMDRYSGPKRYFWHEHEDWKWNIYIRPHQNVQNQVLQCVEWAGPNIRVFGGPMAEHWPKFGTELAPYAPSPLRSARLPGELYDTLEPYFLHFSDRIDSGRMLLTRQEARGFLNMRKIRAIDT
jgi:hypothetical protein